MWSESYGTVAPATRLEIGADDLAHLILGLETAHDEEVLAAVQVVLREEVHFGLRFGEGGPVGDDTMGGVRSVALHDVESSIQQLSHREAQEVLDLLLAESSPLAR